ncbi:hypothetical protein D8674_014017 [Pyrus ussuriensis x Pyrus communis]|uniref:Uncharacterized protein n=1 Tax=Pyrus ussuriensis x Pyrus communis TaxID=2448454 RepID=A0A5N5GS74_9ROSA|nr:hypothetical protein D8674_014017 [Pyrus ussuriensis x Pyrus communis]
MKKSNWDVIHIVNWYDTEKGMFKFKNEYCKVNVDDSTRDSRISKPKENRFIDKYFLEMTRIVALDIGITERDQDAVCLIILYLLNTNLLGSSAGRLHWSLVKNCNSIDNTNQYNYTKETTKYLMESIDRTQKRKRDKQPTINGVVVLLLYWICDHTTIINLIEGKEKRSPTAMKWDLANLHKKIYNEANEDLEVKLIPHILLCKT